MKRIILLKFFLCTSFFSFSQDYVPFVKDTTTWVVSVYPDVLQYYNAIGDTLINGKNYIKVYRGYSPENISSVTLSNDYLSGGLREENKKIYFQPFVNFNDEVLLYDFNLIIGDTFNLVGEYYYLSPSYSMEVVSIDSILTNGNEYRKRINLEGIHEYDLCFYNGGGDDKMSFVEEIGIPNFHSLYFPFSQQCQGNTSFKLNCLVVNGHEIYGACDYLTTTKEIGFQNLSLFLNPTEGEIFVNIKSENNYDIYIHNINGQRTKIPFIGEKIDISAFPSGIYFLEFINTKQRKILKVLKM